MCGSRKTIYAAVFAAFVGVYRLIERNIGGLVFGNERFSSVYI